MALAGLLAGRILRSASTKSKSIAAGVQHVQHVSVCRQRCSGRFETSMALICPACRLFGFSQPILLCCVFASRVLASVYSSGGCL